MKNRVVHKNASFWTDGSGILFGKINNLNPQQKLDDKTARLYLNTIAELSKGKAMPFLIDLRDIKGTFSVEAGQLLGKSMNEMSTILYEVYVVNSLSITLLVQSFKRIYHGTKPFVIFNDMTQALEQCLKYKDKD